MVVQPDTVKRESNVSETLVNTKPLVLETFVVEIIYVTSVVVEPSFGFTVFENV